MLRNNNVIICKIGGRKVVNNGIIPLPTHPYHIVDQSPWPIALSGVLLSLTISAVLSFHGYPLGNLLLLTSFILLNWGMGLWFKDIITEASFLGSHTDKVQKGISLGVVLFIVSEVFFFLSIFWAYFHSSLAPTIEIGSEWPPKGIEPVNASEVPTANTTLLLSSGSAVTVTHHSLVDRLIDWANNGSVATIQMAVFFTLLQVMEYFGVTYTITDSVFGSTFYLGTGLILGPIIIFTFINLIFFNKIQKYSVLNNKLRNNLELNDNISPYWITGFADGESSFTLTFKRSTKGKRNWNVIPRFNIEIHIKDISILERIQKFFKVSNIYLKKDYNKAVYQVGSLKDLNNVIIPHFVKYPLLTEKQRDFELFRLALDLINKKEHLTIEGMRKILSIRASMNRESLNKLNEYFPDIIPLKFSFKRNNEIIDPYWITGFVDAEGCFYIKPRKMKSSSQMRFYLAFRLSQHSRDLLLMKNISKYLNCGIIELSSSYKLVRLSVDKFNDNVNKIIPFFEKYPLLSVKRLDFQSFCNVSCILKDKNNLLSEEDILKIQDIKSNMNRERKNFKE